MVLTDVTTFGVAVGATVMAVEVKDQGGYQRQNNVCGVVANVHGFQNHII